MRHNNFLKVSISLFILSCIFANISSTYATHTQNDIPDIMQPYTIIEYTSNSDFKVIKGGTLNSEASTKLVNELKNNVIIEKNAIKKYFLNETINFDSSLKEKISPIKGMKVLYASDGLIFDIIYPQYYKNPLKKEKSKLTRGIILPEGITQVRSWGNYPNNLYVNKSTNKIIGSGRATTFSDKVGQGNHILKKGDVATKLSFDNCKLGINVSVTSNSNAGSGASLTKTMKKWDAGGMPNAIIDIWKTGVEYWGYKYSSYLSLKGMTTITHDNIDINGGRLY